MKNLIEAEKKIKWSKYYEITDYNVWSLISLNDNLSEDFIREFSDKVIWSLISQYQILSEDFIKEFEDKVDWYYISKYQKLTLDFAFKFKDKIYWSTLLEDNNLCTINLTNEMKDKIKTVMTTIKL